MYASPVQFSGSARMAALLFSKSAATSTEDFFLLKTATTLLIASPATLEVRAVTSEVPAALATLSTSITTAFASGLPLVFFVVGLSGFFVVFFLFVVFF